MITGADLKSLYSDQLASRLWATAARYRRIADTLDGLADRVPRIGTPGTATASGLAHDAIHEIAWGSANASAAAIVSAAADYDRVVGGGQA